MKKLLMPCLISVFALLLVMVGSALAVRVDIEKLEDAEADPQAIPDLIVYDGYTSKDHLSFAPPPANDFTIGVDELNCNVFINVPGAPLTAYYTLILKRLDAPGFKSFKDFAFDIPSKGKYRLTLYWTTCPDWPGQWQMIPIVKSSTGSHIPLNPNAIYNFAIHY